MPTTTERAQDLTVGTRPAFGEAELRAGLARARTLALLVAALVLGGLLLLLQIDRDSHESANKQAAVALATSQAGLISERLDSAFSATYAVASVLRQHNYRADYQWFEPLARELLRYHPAVNNLQLAPGGINQFFVPLAGNEKAIGHNLLLNTKRNKEALQAVASRKLTVAGPFDLLQGGVGVVGRLPVFIGEGRGDDTFWGFSIALVRLDDLLRAADIERLPRAGYDYILWREHPDTGSPHVIARSGPERLTDSVTHSFRVISGTWYLSAQPRAGWLAGSEREFTFKLALILLVTALCGYVSYILLRQPVVLRGEVARRTEALLQTNRLLDQENTERAEAQKKLRLSDEVIEASAEGIMITDQHQLIVRVNRAFETMSGYTADELLGRTPAILNSGRHDAAFFNQMFAALRAEGAWQGEVWNRRKNGEVFPQWLGISALRNAEGVTTHYVSIGSDITERKSAEERIHYLAHYDAMTGLPNRLLLRDRFQQAVAVADRNQTRVALMSIDLDRFKVVNDTLGHQVGDELLRQVVDRLKHSVRASDTISRQGGDEFIVVTQDHAGAQMAMAVAKSIQDHLSGSPFICGGQELSITASIGIALYPDDGQDFDTLIKKCDIAMYHAKESGRATYRFFTDELNVNSADRIQLESELRHAIERRELVLHYQPQIALESGQVVGAEALVRWQHPVKGLVAPGQFIPLAEETGLIVAIDRWVMGEACRQGRNWLDRGLPALVISVNLSGLQFRQSDLVERVQAVLDESGLPPAQLEIELTESVLIDNVESVLATISRLKEVGVRLAIDDFGTGYSSLAYLKRFAVDRLKIDQSFVRGTTPEDAAIVSAVIQLGHSLNLVTIAEGAETSGQVESLRTKGCLEVQGYYFSKPMPAADFEVFLQASLQSKPTV